ncbi:hypothetical protein IIA28_15255 [candidate division KSB1 bacterium]|nr:hypothetical protein [candidate division KSB1 bacterium]
MMSLNILIEFVDTRVRILGNGVWKLGLNDMKYYIWRTGPCSAAIAYE